MLSWNSSGAIMDPQHIWSVHENLVNIECLLLQSHKIPLSKNGPTYTMQDELQQKQRDSNSRLREKLETWRKTCSSFSLHSSQPRRK